MENIYVIGHKNPDSDSICSAFAYANLKNIIDSENNYIASRCGALNRQTKFIFEKLGLDAPFFLKNVYPKVEDVMTEDVIVIKENEPVMKTMETIDELKIRLTPVVSEENKYLGIVSILEIADFFMRGNDVASPVYIFNKNNFSKVLDGFYHRRGEKDVFEASIVVGAMPYERYLKRVQDLNHDKTILIVGKRIDIIEFAISKQFPAIILTGFFDKNDIDLNFDKYKGTVFVSEHDTAETLRRIVMSVPVGTIMNTSLQTLKAEDYIEDIKDLIINDDHKGLPVVDDNGFIKGIITRTDLLKKVSKKLILTDHNELSQAVDGAENAQIVEIIDHHRLGTPKTKYPIYFYTKPVGSTCTLIYQLYKINGVNIDKSIAMVLISGILSDTVILKSPTTTYEDKEALEKLSEIAGINYEEYGKEMFSSTANLKNRSPMEIINADFKIYSEFSLKIGIGQVEVMDLTEIDFVKDVLIDALGQIKSEKNLDWAMLLITDIISGNSRLLAIGLEDIEKSLAYRKIDKFDFSLPGVLSRKKQLLPEILRIAEEFNKKNKKS
jgi:manganese-dependent inorganic pyrophosphatase